MELDKKSKATPTELLVFFGLLLLTPMAYFVHKGFASHRSKSSSTSSSGSPLKEKGGGSMVTGGSYGAA